HHQRRVLLLGVVDPGAEGRGLADAGNVERPGDGARVDVLLGAGVDDDDLILLESVGQFVSPELAGRGQRPEHGRALLVLSLHSGEVRVRVRLAVEHLVDEALFVVALDVAGPPGKAPLVADAGRRDRAEGLAAGAARTVPGEDLDVVR